MVIASPFNMTMLQTHRRVCSACKYPIAGPGCNEKSESSTEILALLFDSFMPFLCKWAGKKTAKCEVQMPLDGQQTGCMHVGGTTSWSLYKLVQGSEVIR